MPTRLQLGVALGLVVVIWASILHVQGVAPLSLEYARPFSIVLGVLVGIAVIAEHWAWRWSFLQGWLFSRPDVRGTWRVIIQSEWIDPKTNQRAAPITAFAGIVQTQSKLQIHLMTPESESCLLANSITPTECGNRFEIAVVYANTPNISLRGVRSERHVGAAIITTHGQSKHTPDSMTAEYWTDRRTVGSMAFEAHVPVVFSRYEDAARSLGPMEPG